MNLSEIYMLYSIIREFRMTTSTLEQNEEYSVIKFTPLFESQRKTLALNDIQRFFRFSHSSFRMFMGANNIGYYVEETALVDGYNDVFLFSSTKVEEAVVALADLTDVARRMESEKN